MHFELQRTTICFGICSAFTFSEIGASSESPGMIALEICYEIVAGLVIGILAGFCMKYASKLSKPMKAFVSLTVVFIIIIVA